MNIYCNSNGSIFHVDPSRVFQGSVGVDVVRFIGRFPSSAQVLMAYKLPNGTWTSPKMLTLVAELEEIQDANGGTFAVWEGRIGASPKIDENGAIVKDENGNVVFDLDYTITENYGTATIQFFVYGATAPITVNGVIQNVGNGLLATASFSFEIEKGVPAIIPEVDTDDAQALLTQILNVVANTQTLYGNVSEDVTKLQEDVQDLDENKVNKSGAVMDGPLIFGYDGNVTEVKSDGMTVYEPFVDGRTEYKKDKIINRDKVITLPVKDGTMALAEDVVGRIELSMDPSNYRLFLMAFDAATGTRTLSSSSIDLPLESMVVGGAYNDETKQIELTLQNGNVVSFPVDELVNGLISSSEKGAPNGVASLDAEGKVPKEQLPDDIGGAASEEAIEEAIAKVHKSYIASDDFSLSVATLRLIVNDVQYNGATVYIKTAGYYPIIFSVEEATHIGVTATLHSYDSGRYRLRVLTYSFDPSVDDSVIITPEGTLKTLVSTTDYASKNNFGLVKLGQGVKIDANNGLLYTDPATKAMIDAGTYFYQPIVPSTVKYAVKVGVTTNTETLTDEEKATACEWLGAENNSNPYELIEKIVVGYSLLTEEPSDWEANYQSYFTNTGTLREPIYTPIMETAAPTWESEKYYSYDGTTKKSVVRRTEPNGQAYEFRKIIVYARVPAGENITGYIAFETDHAGYGTQPRVGNWAYATSEAYISAKAEISNGRIFATAGGSSNNYTMSIVGCDSLIFSSEDWYKKPVNATKITGVNIPVNILPNSEVYIWAVRKRKIL